MASLLDQQYGVIKLAARNALAEINFEHQEKFDLMQYAMGFQDSKYEALEHRFQRLEHSHARLETTCKHLLGTTLRWRRTNSHLDRNYAGIRKRTSPPSSPLSARRPRSREQPSDEMEVDPASWYPSPVSESKKLTPYGWGNPHDTPSPPFNGSFFSNTATSITSSSEDVAREGSSPDGIHDLEQRYSSVDKTRQLTLYGSPNAHSTSSGFSNSTRSYTSTSDDTTMVGSPSSGSHNLEQHNNGSNKIMVEANSFSEPPTQQPADSYQQETIHQKNISASNSLFTQTTAAIISLPALAPFRPASQSQAPMTLATSAASQQPPITATPVAQETRITPSFGMRSSPIGFPSLATASQQSPGYQQPAQQVLPRTEAKRNKRKSTDVDDGDEGDNESAVAKRPKRELSARTPSQRPSVNRPVARAPMGPTASEQAPRESPSAPFNLPIRRAAESHPHRSKDHLAGNEQPSQAPGESPSASFSLPTRPAAERHPHRSKHHFTGNEQPRSLQVARPLPKEDPYAIARAQNDLARHGQDSNKQHLPDIRSMASPVSPHTIQMEDDASDERDERGQTARGRGKRAAPTQRTNVPTSTSTPNPRSNANQQSSSGRGNIVPQKKKRGGNQADQSKSGVAKKNTTKPSPKITDAMRRRAEYGMDYLDHTGQNDEGVAMYGPPSGPRMRFSPPPRPQMPPLQQHYSVQAGGDVLKSTEDVSDEEQTPATHGKRKQPKRHGHRGRGGGRARAPSPED